MPARGILQDQTRSVKSEDKDKRKLFMKMKKIPLFSALLAMGFFGCGSDDSGPVVCPPNLGVGLDSMTTTASGLQYQDLLIGDGAMAQAGNAVVVHYTGWLTDGTKFDSSVDRGTPFSFNLGAGEVIPGWDEGVAGMRVCGKRKLLIPPELAYGDAGAGGAIPPGATLEFDVELLEVN
jgi:hypothetical protein